MSYRNQIFSAKRWRIIYEQVFDPCNRSGSVNCHRHHSARHLVAAVRSPRSYAKQKLFAERVKNIPTKFGDWESKDTPVDPRQIAASGSDAYFSRHFYNRLAPDQVVEVFIVSGNGRDITQHTPDQCFVLNGGYDQEDQESFVVDAGRTTARFSTSRFRKGTSALEGPRNLRCFWSFSDNGEWVAPSGTLQKFLAGSPALFKIYAISDLPLESSGRPDDCSAVPFLRQFLPLLTKALFPPDSDAASSSPPATDSKTSGADSTASPATDAAQPATGSPDAAPAADAAPPK